MEIVEVKGVGTVDDISRNGKEVPIIVDNLETHSKDHNLHLPWMLLVGQRVKCGNTSVVTSHNILVSDNNVHLSKNC